MKWLAAFWRWFRPVVCRHEFKLIDLDRTNIPEPVLAPDATYEQAMQFYGEQMTCRAFTHRVRWPCAKCGQVFHAHCGLDILSRHGH